MNPSNNATKMKKKVRLLLHGGDTMLGRAIQLTLPYQSLHEEKICDSISAENYLQLGLHFKRCGVINQRDVDIIRKQNQDGGKYLWGDYLQAVWMDPPPDLRIINLETAVTHRINHRDIPTKGINYHMNAANLPIAFRKFAFHPFVRPEMPTPKTPEEEMQEEFDQVPEHVGEAKTRPTHVPIVPYVVSLANNHAMDFGRTAFETETLPAMDTLPGKAFFAGVGMNFEEAAKAVSVTISDKKTTIHVVALTTQCAGTPKYWNANSKRSGMVCLPPMITMEAVEEAFSITCRVFEMNGLKMDHHHTSNDNIIVLSIHWGPNWAYRYRDDLDYQRYRQLYAQRVIDKLGVDVLYGHSSHHIRGMELYKKKLIIYGAGDLVNDYEGFSNRGDEIYNKFGGLFVVDMDANDGHLVNLAIIPTYMYKLQLKRVQENSHRWDPQKEEVTLVMNGATGLCQDINKLSTMDVGDHGEPLTLRTIPEHPEIPGGPVLVYP